MPAQRHRVLDEAVDDEDDELPEHVLFAIVEDEDDEIACVVRDDLSTPELLDLLKRITSQVKSLRRRPH